MKLIREKMVRPTNAAADQAVTEDYLTTLKNRTHRTQAAELNPLLQSLVWETRSDYPLSAVKAVAAVHDKQP